MGAIRLNTMKKYMLIKYPTPLLGHIAFGIIDRGTNLLQVRPTSFCALSCIFCSVDAGPCSRHRQTEYNVDINYLVDWVKKIAYYKNEAIHAHIDATGDPILHPKITNLVRQLHNLSIVKSISMETHGALLTERKLDELDDAGLSRLNLSIDSIDPTIAKKLAGTPWFNIKKVLGLAKYITSSLKMDLLIAPVWVPGINDKEIPKIIKFALDIGAGKRWPPLGIQKYEAHKYGRKPQGVKPMKWREFYNKLREWEQEYSVKLIIKPEDFGIKKSRRVPIIFQRFEKVGVRIIGPGWLKKQWIGVARKRVITIVGVKGQPPLGETISARILRTKDGIYVAEPA